MSITEKSLKLRNGTFIKLLAYLTDRNKHLSSVELKIIFMKLLKDDINVTALPVMAFIAYLLITDYDTSAQMTNTRMFFLINICIYIYKIIIMNLFI